MIYNIDLAATHQCITIINDSFLTDTTDTEELSACAPTGAAPGRFAYEDEARFVRGGKTRRRLPRLKSKASLRGAERFASADAESAPDEAGPQFPLKMH